MHSHRTLALHMHPFWSLAWLDARQVGLGFIRRISGSKPEGLEMFSWRWSGHVEDVPTLASGVGWRVATACVHGGGSWGCAGCCSCALAQLLGRERLVGNFPFIWPTGGGTLSRLLSVLRIVRLRPRLQLRRRR